MARPKQDNPELFSSGEISHGTGLSIRSQQFLRDKELTPDAEQMGEGGRPANQYGAEGMMHFAIAGAFHTSGLGLTHSAVLAKELRYEFNTFTLGYMSGLDRQARFRGVPLPPSEDSCLGLHYAIRMRPDSGYVPRQSFDNDMVLVIADQRHVLLDILGDPKMAHSLPTPVCQLTEDQDKPILPVHEMGQWEDIEEWVTDDFRRALKDAVGIVRINVSLAIRNCLDSIFDLRVSKGGKVFAAWDGGCQ